MPRLFYAALILLLLGMAWAGARSFNELNMRERQAEARSELDRLQRQMHIYYMDRKRYSLSFTEVAYEPREGRRNYAIGVAPACAPASADTRIAPFRSEYTEGREREIDGWFEAMRVRPCEPMEEGFTAYAVGVIQPGGELDVWRINAKKELVHLQDGTGKKKGSLW